MISESEQTAWRESMSADEAAEMARIYNHAASNPDIARPGDAQLAKTYQAIADRKRNQ